MLQPAFPLNLTLDQILSRAPLIVFPETPVIEVLQSMSQIRSRRCTLTEAEKDGTSGRNSPPQSSYALVQKDNHLLGIVTERDVVRLTATGKPLAGIAVAEMMTSPVIALNSADYQDVFDILDLFEKYQIRHLPVVDQQNQLLGVVTSDNLRRELSITHVLKLRRVREVMTTEILYTPPTASVLHVAQQMAQHRVSCIAIAIAATDNTVYPVGMLTERDIVQFQALNLDLATLPAKTVMSYPLLCLHPEDSLWMARDFMQQHHIRRCVITGNQGELQGIITQSDILQAVEPADLYETIAELQQELEEKITQLQQETHQCEQLKQALETSETRYQSSEAQLQEVLNSIQAAIVRLRIFTPESWEVEYYSPGCEQVFSYTAQEFVNDPDIWRSRMHPEDFEQVLLPWLETLCQNRFSQGTTILEYRFQHRDRTWHWISETVTFCWDALADCWVLTTIGLDISDRKRVEEALQSSQAKLNDVLNTVNAGITCFQLIDDRTWEYDYYSGGCETLFGFTAQELMSEPALWRSRVLPADLETVIYPQLQAFFSRQSQGATLEYRFQHKDGSWRWISDTATVRHDDYHNTCIVTIVAIDITERKQIEQSLRSQAEQERLLSNITSHIRDSLDLDTILATTSIEVQRTLQADRALIFCLKPNGSGQVIEEAVVPEYPVTQQMEWKDECFPEDCTQYYLQGQPRIVLDVATDDWAACLIDFMQEVGVKSKIVAPIIQNTKTGPKVWGLLIVHACSHYRQWQPTEAEFLQQIANQLAIAIQQADLYRQLQTELTERQRTQEILYQREAELREAQRVAHVGSWKLDTQTQCVIASEEMLRLFDLAPACFTLTYNEYLEYIHPSDRRAVQSQLIELIATGKAYTHDFRILRADGSICYVEGRGEAIRNAQGNIVQIRGTILDISDRKQAETTLRNSENRFRTLFADAPTGMVLSTEQGQIVQVNQSLCQMLECGEPDLQGRSLQEIIDPQDVQQELHLTQQLFAQKISSYKLEKRLIKQNGEAIWVSLTAGLLQDPNQGTLYKLGMYENITERRTIERMKDHFISVVSHELRTPLSSIRGSLGLLATGQLGTLDPDGQELLSIAASETQRLTRLVSDILDLERMKSGHITLVKDVHRVTNLIARSIESVRSLARESKIDLEVSAVPEEIWVDGDRIIQTLTNLLSNAIKFSPPHTTVSIRAQRVERHLASRSPEGHSICELSPFCTCSLLHYSFPYLLFCLSDQGRGIPPEKLNTIFEPFEQVDIGDAYQKDGSGLGLAICKSIIQRHGGQIWVTSTVGQGSNFFFTLPITQRND